MKKSILILIIILTTGILKAQSNRKCLFANKKEYSRSLNIKRMVTSFRQKRTDSSFSFFHGNMFRPKFSVDILDGSGIHIMNTPEIGPVPSMSVGARFKAGLVITI
jgi:hypothetical protein